jgi:PAS domain S-box-containing protein
MAEKKPVKHSDLLRQRAEQMLKYASADVAQLSTEAIQRIIQDLNVHQIELELQNEELQQTYAELKEARDKYADLYDFAPIGYITTSTAANIILSANLTFCRIIGVDRTILIGKRITRYIDREFMDTYYLHQKEAIRTGAKAACEELLMHRADNSTFYARLESIPFGADQLRTAVIDITVEKQAKDAQTQLNTELEKKVAARTAELAEANEQLKQYGRRITQVQEEERKRIAYELHDDTAQYLSILKLELDALLQSGKIKDPEMLEKIRFLEKDASRAFDDVRRYSHELRPGVLEHLGLHAALEQMAEDVNKLKQITVELQVEGCEQELTEDVKLGLFRIAQEAINNARKHSRAETACIDLCFYDSGVRMLVKDNGIGFNFKDKAARTKQRSLGLMSMQERARLIGAVLKIDSQPGRGTRIEVEVPANGEGMTA